MGHGDMVNLLLAATTALLMAPTPPGDGRKPAPVVIGQSRIAQVRIQQHVVIRVPRPDSVRRVSAPAAPLPPIAWVEKDSDKCVKIQNLAGATISRPDSVDLFLSGGKRVRARLGNECPALDFYTGFYVKPTKDGMVCAKRDVFRSRSGGECRIKAFRTLVPQR
jgi:hypothetical protein